MGVFENTIAFGTFFNAGGVQTLSGSSYQTFDYEALAVDGHPSKNIDPYGSDDGFQVRVLQKGAYFTEFSFVAGSGDGKQYAVKPFINGSEAITTGLNGETLFYQQPVEQEYEVSTSLILDLRAGDKLSWRIWVSAVPTLDFYARNIKMSLFNLQQLGIH